MAKHTKRQLISAFEQILLEKPLDKITISDITDACKVNRMTFYYHFRDLNNLIQAAFALLSETAFADYQKGEDLTVTLERLIRELAAHKDFTLRLFEELDHRELVNGVLKTLHGPISDYVEIRAEGTNLSEDQVIKVIYFYACALTGLIMHWIAMGMQDPTDNVMHDLSHMLDGTCEHMIDNFARDARE